MKFEQPNFQNQDKKKSDNQVLKSFSKERSADERKELAQEILESRKKHFEKQERIKGEMVTLKEKIEAQVMSIEAVVADIKNMENELADNKSNVIKKILTHFGNQKVQKNIELGIEENKRLEGEYIVMQDLLKSLDEERLNSYHLDNVKEKIDLFYSNEEGKYQEYKRVKEVRQVENIVEKYDTLFVHTFRIEEDSYFGPLKRDNMDLRTKMEIVLALNPDVCASSINAGDSAGKLYGGDNIGFILKGGSVMSANGVDAGSSAEARPQDDDESIEQNIHSVITENNSKSHNEYSIRNPEVAGCFIEYSAWKGSTSRVLEITNDLKMPLYYMHNGEIYNTLYNNETGELEKKEKTGLT